MWTAGDAAEIYRWFTLQKRAVKPGEDGASSLEVKDPSPRRIKPPPPLCSGYFIYIKMPHNIMCI